MSLRRRLISQILLMTCGVALAGAAGAVGVRGLHQDFGVALRGNEQLRFVYEIGMRVAAARSSLIGGSNDAVARARSELNAARTYLESSRIASDDDDGQFSAIRESIVRAAQRLDADDPPADATSLLAPTYTALADFSATTRQTITSRQTAADRKQRVTLAAVLAITLVAAVVAVIAGVRQYRSVIRPLNAIGDAARSIAAGKLDHRAQRLGDDEFASLAADFNRMADELQALCTDLEHRVEHKSRQLAQSERLASVGYLAAGVAHEINNPLGIIAGYGERSLRHLDVKALDASCAQRVREALGVICDEAFRCKTITNRLLMLARSGDEARRAVRLDRIASDVIASIRAIARFENRRVCLTCDGDGDGDGMVVFANEGEMRQVLLNLVVNGLEASTTDEGRVDIAIRRDDDDTVRLTVSDDGCGMDSETLARAFEPFFTEKRGERPGTGLGLAVVHAIVSDHGGTIEASSAGKGRGSTFTMQLPTTEASHASHN